MDLYQEWKRGKLPIINGIIYEDGTIEQIKIIYDSNYDRIISHGNNVHLNDLKEKNELNFSAVSTSYYVEDILHHIKVFYGGGSYGSEGYIVVESTIIFGLLWIAFFEESNPFEKLELINDEIYATNNLNEQWVFPIKKPAQISIKKNIDTSYC